MLLAMICHDLYVTQRSGVRVANGAGLAMFVLMVSRTLRTLCVITPSVALVRSVALSCDLLCFRVHTLSAMDFVPVPVGTAPAAALLVRARVLGCVCARPAAASKWAVHALALPQA